MKNIFSFILLVLMPVQGAFAMCSSLFDQSDAVLYSRTEDYLKSVSEKDFEYFQSFFDPEQNFTAILPDGRVFGSLDAFMENQKGWFGGSTGSFKYRVLQTTTSNDVGIANTIVNYSNFDSQGKEFELEIYISFTFKCIAGNWVVVHIQNTTLRKIR